jgi:FAD/FMN-containing dehydrogenase
MTNEDVALFKGQLRGEVIEPTDPGYDEARKVYNGMIDRKPRLIAKCADVADVIASVHFARAQRLALAIRGGGHNAEASGSATTGSSRTSPG